MKTLHEKPAPEVATSVSRLLKAKTLQVKSLSQYTSIDRQYLFDAESVIKAIQLRNGDHDYLPNLHGMSYCWRCGRSKRYGGLVSVGTAKHRLSSAVCRTCIHTWRRIYCDVLERSAFIDDCRDRIARAYLNRDMGVSK